MNDRIVKSHGEALASFVALKAEIDDLLSRIHGASADHFNASPDDVHWGHVGSLGHVAEKLREVAAFFESLMALSEDRPDRALPGGARDGSRRPIVGRRCEENPDEAF